MNDSKPEPNPVSWLFERIADVAHAVDVAVAPKPATNNNPALPPPENGAPVARWRLSRLTLIPSDNNRTYRPGIDSAVLVLEIPDGFEPAVKVPRTRAATSQEIHSYEHWLNAVVEKRKAAYTVAADEGFAVRNFEQQLTDKKQALARVDLEGPEDPSKTAFDAHLARVKSLQGEIASLESQLTAAKVRASAAGVASSSFEADEWYIDAPEIPLVRVAPPKVYGEFF